MRRILALTMIAFGLLAALLDPVLPILAAGTTERVSVDSNGVEGNAESSNLAISGDGRFVAFESRASNLVPGDTNFAQDIFVRDRRNNTTARISNSNQNFQYSSMPSISADGRFIAFSSSVSNLVAGDTNGSIDAFVYDQQTRIIERASLSASGQQANNECGLAAISGDGRFVVFATRATNLVTDDTNGVMDIFVHDRQTGATERVSLDSHGIEANGQSGLGGISISGDGRFVSFVSEASNLVPNDTNDMADVFVRDRQAGTTERASVNTASVQANARSMFYPRTMSSDGRFVAFLSFASNLVAEDSNLTWDVFVRDRQAGTTERVSVGSAGEQANDGSYNMAISGDGSVIAFVSYATNLVAGDTNGAADMFVHNRLQGTTELVSLGSAGEPANDEPSLPAVNGNGSVIAFMSAATNLVADDTNRASDIFVRPWTRSSAPLDPPTVPDLAESSDSGASATDNLTNDITPIFAGTAGPGTTVTILVDGVEQGSGDVSDGRYSITTGALSAGTHAVTARAATSAGNTSPVSGALSMAIDTEAPTAIITSAPAALATSANVQFGFEAETGATFSCALAPGLDAFEACEAPRGYGPLADGAYAFTVMATDVAGNAGPAVRYAFAVDATAPTITLSAPSEAPYILGQAVAAAYRCQDTETGSGVALCAGTTADGGPIDTGSVGHKTFTVQASDKAGNTASRSLNYSVSYNICPLYDQSKSHRSGSVVSVKLQLCNSGGASVSSSSIAVHAAGLKKLDSTASTDLDPATATNPDSDFRYDTALGGTGGYIYNLSTKNLAAGTWALSFTASGDPNTHTVQFDVR
jgi:Tol biopolymer transport system component